MVETNGGKENGGEERWRQVYDSVSIFSKLTW